MVRPPMALEWVASLSRRTVAVAMVVMLRWRRASRARGADVAERVDVVGVSVIEDAFL